MGADDMNLDVAWEYQCVANSNTNAALVRWLSNGQAPAKDAVMYQFPAIQANVLFSLLRSL